MDQLSVFNFESFNVRVIMIDNELWFVAKDVCDILGIVNSNNALGYLEDDEKGIQKIYTLGGWQSVIVVNESGLYTLIIRSNKVIAKKFRRWITSDILPSIRKTGQYGIDNLSRIDLAKMVIAAEEEKILLESKIKADKPKVDFAEQLAESENLITVQEMAKSMGVGSNTLFAFMRSAKYAYYERQMVDGKERQYNLPSQYCIDRDYMRVITRMDKNGNTYPRIYFTGKGKVWIWVKWNGINYQPDILQVEAKKEGKFFN